VTSLLHWLRLYNTWAAPVVITTLVLANLLYWLAS